MTVVDGTVLICRQVIGKETGETQHGRALVAVLLPFHLPNLAGTFHSKPCTKYAGEKNEPRSLDGLTWPAV